MVENGKFGNLLKEHTSTRSKLLFQTKMRNFGKEVGKTVGLNGHGTNKTSGLREGSKLVAKEKATVGKMDSRSEDQYKG